MEKYLILAAGEQTRWEIEHDGKLPKIKQLVEVSGEILIKRIQRQFPNSLVVTNNKEIIKHSKFYFMPKDSRVTVATLYSTISMWSEWTTVLLGDVNYGKKTIGLIKNQEDPLMFYGNQEEIFALKFHIKEIVKIVRSIHDLLADKDWKPKYGKLWNLYRKLNWMDFRVHDIKNYFTFVNDCKDYDNCKQYYKWNK